MSRHRHGTRSRRSPHFRPGPRKQSCHCPRTPGRIRSVRQLTRCRPRLSLPKQGSSCTRQTRPSRVRRPHHCRGMTRSRSRRTCSGIPSARLAKRCRLRPCPPTPCFLCVRRTLLSTRCHPCSYPSSQRCRIHHTLSGNCRALLVTACRLRLSPQMTCCPCTRPTLLLSPRCPR